MTFEGRPLKYNGASDAATMTPVDLNLSCRERLEALAGYEILDTPEAGMNGHVAKPIDRRELALVMSQLLPDPEGRCGANSSYLN